MTGLFEVDLVSGQVTRQGRRVPVQEQPFRVLSLLLECPGEIVTREKLQSKLWPADTYVGFDEGLNTAIRKLRILFGDSADNPRFIETIPRRGYRFIAPVTELPSIGEPFLPSDEISSTPFLVQPRSIEVEEGAPERVELPGGYVAPSEDEIPSSGSAEKKTDYRQTPRRKLAIAITAIAALLVAAASIIWRLQPRRPAASNIVRLTNDRKAKIPINGLLTDGLRLYFLEGNPRGSGSGIAQVSASGGETTWIATSLKEALAVNDISPDKSKLIVVRVGDSGAAGADSGLDEFWVQPLPAGSPHRIEIKALSVGWTPDGAHIIYSYQHKVYIANEDGTDPRAIAEVPGPARWFRFSPDGRRIRFSLLQEGGNASSIWEMGADGTNPHQLLPGWKGPADQCCGRWSPDGDYYYFLTAAFFLGGAGVDEALWVIPERHSMFRRNSGPIRLSTGPLRFGAPTPSTDGKTLFAVGDESRVELVSVEPQSQRFDPYLGGISAGPIAFSSDGKWVAYISYPEMTLWKSRTDLSEKMQLTFPPVRAFGARWSPDGSQIVFNDAQFHKAWKAYLISPSGGDSPKPIAPSKADDFDTDPTWTPDGKSIIFSRREAGGEGNQAIYRVDLANGNLTMIPESEGLFSPRISPDGQRIAALTRNAQKLVLFDQKTWSTLAEGEHFGFNEWSPDGKYVYAEKSGGGFGRIVRVRTRDRVSEEVLSLRDFPLLIDPFASWYGLTPDGKILLMRDRSVQEVYALTLEMK
jgi:Tol biopolymer transport system component/DNA-binding winged helix-turn-helix (wHTH) protein